MATKSKKREPPTISLFFSKNGGVEPDGFMDVTLNDKARIILDVKVTSLSHSTEEWDNGKRLSGEIITCRIDPAEEKADTAKTLYPDMKE